MLRVTTSRFFSIFLSNLNIFNAKHRSVSKYFRLDSAQSRHLLLSIVCPCHPTHSSSLPFTMSVPGPTYVTDLTSHRPIIGKTDPEPETFQAALSTALHHHPDRTQYILHTGEQYSLSRFYYFARDVASSLIAVGVQPLEGVSILGSNSIEWFAADVGATLAAAIPAGIYTTNTPEVVSFIINDSNSRIIFLHDMPALDNLLSVLDKCPNLKTIVIWGEYDPAKYSDHKGLIYTWKDFLNLADLKSRCMLDARMMLAKPESVCKLIYTSGTTGPPKAVMISHDNITFTIKLLQREANVQYNDMVVSFLPASHIAANLIDICAALVVGCRVHIAPPDALKGSLVQTLRLARPTIFISVPRVYEKIQEKLLQIGAESGPVKRAISTWAKAIGTKASFARDAGDDLMPWGFHLAQWLVFSNVKKALGLDRCRFIFNAAAPLQQNTRDYFRSLNFEILDIYGMSEATGPLTSSYPHYRRGTSGQPCEGIEAKLVNEDESGEGELCFRGRNMFLGYLHNEKESEKAMDKDGFIHTGDLGRIDKDGYVTITGRAKELIVTAGGENVAPVLVENNLKTELPAISRVFAVGDTKNFVGALVVPYMDENGGLIGPASRVNENVTNVEQAMSDETWERYILDGISKANEHAVSNAAKIRKYVMLKRDFAIETGELTPSLKVMRKKALEIHNAEVEKIYAK